MMTTFLYGLLLGLGLGGVTLLIAVVQIENKIYKAYLDGWKAGSEAGVAIAKLERKECKIKITIPTSSKHFKKPVSFLTADGQFGKMRWLQ